MLGVGGSIGPAAGRRRRQRAGPEDLRARSGRRSRRRSARARPTATTWSRSASFLQEQGFVVGENAAFGGVGRHDPRRLPLQVRRPRRDRRQLRRRPATSSRTRSTPSTRSSRRCASSASARSGARRATTTTCTSTSRNSGPIGAGCGGADGGFAGPLEDVLMRGPADRLGRARRARSSASAASAAATSAARPTRRRRARSARVARELGASDKVLLAAYEAAIVESGVHSLPYGDRDSIGLFQQRDSWGSLRAADGPRVGLAAVHLAGDPPEPAVDDAPGSSPRTCRSRPSPSATTSAARRPSR